jgi:hypothetical protein
MEAIQALYRIYAPKLFEETKAGQRGRTKEARVLDELNAFAADQLCKVKKFPRARVIKLICYPKGHRDAGNSVYGKEHELNKPLQGFPQRLQEFRDDLMANLVPLELFDLSQPNFFTLK